MPKNRFGELDELERREGLNSRAKNTGNDLGFPVEMAFPLTAYPYDAKFVYPFVSAGLPEMPADWDNGNADNKGIS